MNLGAFAVVAFLRNAMRSEEIADYAGLIRRCPGVTICFSIDPHQPDRPAAFGRFRRASSRSFLSLVAGQSYLLLVIGGLNTAISLFYYLRVVKTMTMDPEPETRLPADFR